jgi:hypothetical protein
MKAGRNEPCPCGSGKKYKKCCLAEDERIIYVGDNEKILFEDDWEPEDNVWEENQVQLEEDDFEEEEMGEMDEIKEKEEDEETRKAIDCILEDMIMNRDDEEEPSVRHPELSDEEMKLVDDWCEKYKKMKDTVKEREHLWSFINLYPHLVDHLELHHKVLFELGNGHFIKGIYDDFVELLLKIRDEYPVTYKKIFKHLDSDLIFWYVAQGRLDEIDRFFDNFRDDGQYNDKLEDLIDFFLVKNREDILMTSFAGSKIKT